jgi:hypothetical protein
MVRVGVDRPTLLFGDNKGVVLNTTIPLSVLKQKHHTCAYHWVREAIAGGIMQFIHIPESSNYADVLSKPLPSDVFHRLIKPLLFCVPKSEREGGS